MSVTTAAIEPRSVQKAISYQYLLACMKHNPAEPPGKVETLKQELGEYHHASAFSNWSSMGDGVGRNLEIALARHLM